MFKSIELFQKIFLVIPGAYFGLLCSFIFGITVSTGLLFQILEDPTFSIFTRWISHLSIGCEISRLCFLIGLCVGSCFNLIFENFVINQFFYQKENNQIILILYGAAFIQSLGCFFAGIFPLSLQLLHGFAANLYFYGALTFYSGLFFLIIKSRRCFRRILFFCSICIINTTLLLIVNIYCSIIANPFAVYTNYFLEWMTFISYLSANIVIALEFVQEKKPKNKEILKQRNGIKKPIILFPIETMIVENK